MVVLVQVPVEMLVLVVTEIVQQNVVLVVLENVLALAEQVVEDALVAPVIVVQAAEVTALEDVQGLAALDAATLARDVAVAQALAHQDAHLIVGLDVRESAILPAHLVMDHVHQDVVLAMVVRDVALVHVVPHVETDVELDAEALVVVVVLEGAMLLAEETVQEIAQEAVAVSVIPHVLMHVHRHVK